jgi:hypothetical protein
VGAGKLGHARAKAKWVVDNSPAAELGLLIVLVAAGLELPIVLVAAGLEQPIVLVAAGLELPIVLAAAAVASALAIDNFLGVPVAEVTMPSAAEVVG